MRRVWIHIEYWITFLLIPLIVAVRELIRVGSDLMIWWDIKRQMKAQWERYMKFIES